MGQLDRLFRAFTDYRKNTKEERDCKRARRSVSRANADADRLQVVRTECEVENDWIDAIEEGLVFIGKAIAEERQFIRSNGEVQDIEKVKSVSRESVEHLARHSNLFTKDRGEGEDIIPDRLFTVERLTDYAVYENRFLYMLLCYLRDFIAYRYEKIVALTSMYSGSLSMQKSVEADDRKLRFEIFLDEEKRNDAYLAANHSAKEQVDRIDGLLKTVLLYLSLPLMEFVAKAPMLKPPITETNVLKMNKNFKGAMRLYYFITSYEKDGFTVKKDEVSLHPFERGLADEFAEIAELSSFLTYEHGLKLEEYLQKKYDEQEEAKKREEQERERRQLESLKRRIEESGKGEKEYMLLMEKRLRALENDKLQLIAARAEIETLHDKIGRLHQKIEEVSALAETRKKRNEELLISHQTEIRALTKEREDRLRSAEEEREAEKTRLLIAHESALREQKESADKILRQTAETYEEAAKAEKQRTEERAAALLEQIGNSKDALEKEREESARLHVQAELLEREKTLSEARLNALKKECGRFSESDSFTSREQFAELERQYKVFKTFFKEEWKKTKKQIRAELLHSSAEKKDGE